MVETMKFRTMALLTMLAAGSLAGCTPTEEDPIEVNDNGEPYSDEGIGAWGEAYETRETGKSDQPGCSGVLVPDRTGFGGRVSLTFDDGPEPASTNIVLDILQEQNIKAAFFINGKRVNSQADRDVLQRILDEGHILANHSQNHSNLKTLDLAQVESEVDRTHQIIQDAGEDPLYFRFPFGSSSCGTADLVRSFGYRVTGWHIDSADWCFASSRGGVGHCDPRTFQYVPDSLRDDMPGLVMEQVQQHNGGILLFHDVHMNTAQNLNSIIDNLKAANFSFVNVDDVSTFPLLNNDDVQDFKWIGDACTESADCGGFAPSAECFAYDGTNVSAGFCTMGCEGYCDDFPGRAPTFCVSLDGGETGNCVSQAHDRNANCADILGTIPVEKTRYVGPSSAPESTSTVCLPEGI